MASRGEVGWVLIEALGVIVIGGHAHLGGDCDGVESEAIGVEFEAHGAGFPDEIDELGGVLCS